MTTKRSLSASFRKLSGEPLVHFMLIGGGLFALFAARGGPVSDAEPVVVSEAQISRFAEAFGRTWQRPPTEQELQALVGDHIREEILYREALAMGLDRDDAVIRRRMRQKMEFLTEDLASRQPTEEDLEKFLTANMARFVVEGQTSFDQIYFSTDRRGASAEENARTLLARMRADPPEPNEIAALGDPLSLANTYEMATPNDIDRTFGEGFHASMAGVPQGEWSGPVRSGYGLHLVRVRARTQRREPGLDEVRNEVAREWSVRERARVADELFQELSKKYDVVVELPGAATP